ncbi:hypothetical protein NLJ89_g10642 [Agrocybe chaxingu]|uniref:Uncharacterized protein n=1 Tax=Agrocybe chaxingu TaxID=84603 RepID=A0A9W8JYA2_9AGAR|nr:hypothetical protein NLJ89_g10642 [Agrocybe chaxingu]
MTDLDVQDVRDVFAKQKQELLTHQQLMAKMKRLTDNPNMTKEDLEMYEQLKEAVTARHERNEKAKRLGLVPEAGQHPASHVHSHQTN